MTSFSFGRTVWAVCIDLVTYNALAFIWPSKVKMFLVLLPGKFLPSDSVRHQLSASIYIFEACTMYANNY